MPRKSRLGKGNLGAQARSLARRAHDLQLPAERLDAIGDAPQTGAVRVGAAKLTTVGWTIRGR
jgi:hypothetical protein